MSPSSRADAGLLRAAFGHALARPLLLAPPLAVATTLALERAFGDGAGTVESSIVGSLASIAACVACAELWLAEEGRPDWRRLRTALAFYLLPVLVLGAVGVAAATFFTVAMRGSDPAGLRGPLFATIVAAKLASGLATVWASFAIGLWNRERGALGALRDGARLLAAHLGFAAVMILGAWIAQEAASFALGALSGAAAGVSFFTAFAFAADALAAGAALAACVALPLQAAVEAR